jgi:hypothetical protein
MDSWWNFFNIQLLTACTGTCTCTAQAYEVAASLLALDCVDALVIMGLYLIYLSSSLIATGDGTQFILLR